MKTPKGAGMQFIKSQVKEARYGVCSGCMQRTEIYYVNGIYRCSRCRRHGDLGIKSKRKNMLNHFQG